MKTKLKWMVVILALIFVALQFTSPPRTNPPIDETKTLQVATGVPADVSALLSRSCNDCHSNQTEWRWYTHIAPISWLTVGHVIEGRSELNFSEWGNYGDRMKETRLAAICELVKQDEMPLSSYKLLHQNAVLSPDGRNIICDWAEKERSRLTAK